MCYTESFYINIILKQNKIINTLTVPFQKSKTVSFTLSKMKNIVALFYRFPVKLICCIAFG